MQTAVMSQDEKSRVTTMITRMLRGQDVRYPFRTVSTHSLLTFTILYHKELIDSTQPLTTGL